jgi:hypothetical protein
MDIERLRDDLISYFGTAIYYNPMTIMELEEVKRANEYELIKIALDNKFDLERYEIKER